MVRIAQGWIAEALDRRVNSWVGWSATFRNRGPGILKLGISSGKGKQDAAAGNKESPFQETSSFVRALCLPGLDPFI
jgi:hypothetical protein